MFLFHFVKIELIYFCKDCVFIAKNTLTIS